MLRYLRIQLNSSSLYQSRIIARRGFCRSTIQFSSKRILKISDLEPPISAVPSPLNSECLNLELGFEKEKSKKKKKIVKAGNMITYIHLMMQQYPDSVILTRVGSFYELYFHQAIELGPVMNLRIGRKNQLSPINGDPYVPMAGFPFYQLQSYLKILVEDLKKTVVLLDQVPSEVVAGSNESEKRPVTRIITAGTLVGESFLNSSENNYIAAIQFTNNHLESAAAASNRLPPNSPVGIAWLDISVGTFYHQLTTVSDLMSEVVRINPKEILLDNIAKKLSLESTNLSQLSELNSYMITYKKFPVSTSFSDFIGKFNQPPAEVLYSIKDADEKSISAITILLKYISENIPGSIMKLKVPEQQIPSEYMKIDSTTRKGLELFESSQNNDTVRGTLYNVINRTVTQSGARMLRSWLSSPLLSIDKIKDRQDLVQYFINHKALTTHIIHSIQRIDDCQRTIQKLGMQKFDAMDLIGLARSIAIIADIHKLLQNEVTNDTNNKSSPLEKWHGLLNNRMAGLQKLAKNIETSIDIEILEMNTQNEAELLESEISLLNSEIVSPEFLELQRERRAKREAAEFRSILKESASKTLKKLSIMQTEYLSEMERLDKQFKDLYPSVKVSLKWAPQYGYHVHITGTETKLASINPIGIEGHQIKPTKKTIIIQNDEWIQLGLKKDYIQNKREEEEQKILNRLRESALELADSVRECCTVLDQIDISASFAILANEQSLVKPKITDDNTLTIIDGRHLTVETGLKSNGILFTSNDCDLGGKENFIWMITGPNMGGKSTFIRQVALISILSQIGCFVPCSEATIGIVDKIFCRIGAGDDLYRGRSTFMVEMLETGSILKNATNRSLAILDEVGRGTSGRDGLAIAYATLVHLLEENKCRSLYATHFGSELGKLLKQDKKDENISFYRTSIRSDYESINSNSKLEGTEFFFDHKLERGISQNSHGLKIAAMAGFPPSVLALAESAWKRLGEE